MRGWDERTRRWTTACLCIRSCVEFRAGGNDGTNPKTYDTFHMGRSSIDLYSNDIGARFADITSFAAYVGGSPTNISVGAGRLGIKPVLLTALGADPVGDFILNFLEKEAVETKYILRKPGHRTSAVVLGIEPPDRFPLVYYRDNCADIELTIDDVLAAPIADTKVFQFAGTNLSKEPSCSATFFAAELARLPVRRWSLILISARISGMTLGHLASWRVPSCRWWTL